MERAAGFITKNRIIGLVAGILLLALLAGGAFALLERPGLTANTPGPYATLPAPSPITASTNGYTVTLYPVSADPSRVFMTYTISAPPPHDASAIYLADSMTPDWELIGPTLKQEDGSEIPARSIYARVYGTDNYSGLKSAPTPAAESNYPLAFDTTHLMNISPTLSLHLTGDLIAAKSTTEYGPFTDVITGTVARNLSFDFTLPVNPYRRVADVNQTSKAEGLTITLDRVAVSASETVLYMHGLRDPVPQDEFYQEGDIWPVDFEIKTGTTQVKTDSPDPSVNYPLGDFGLEQKSVTQTTANESSWVIYYPSSHLQSDNQWTVSIGEMFLGREHGDSGLDYKGPWTFHFTMPGPTTDNSPLAPPDPTPFK